MAFTSDSAHMLANLYRNRKQRVMEELGLETGNPDAVIEGYLLQLASGKYNAEEMQTRLANKQAEMAARTTEEGRPYLASLLQAQEGTRRLVAESLQSGQSVQELAHATVLQRLQAFTPDQRKAFMVAISEDTKHNSELGAAGTLSQYYRPEDGSYLGKTVRAYAYSVLLEAIGTSYAQPEQAAPELREMAHVRNLLTTQYNRASMQATDEYKHQRLEQQNPLHYTLEGAVERMVASLSGQPAEAQKQAIQQWLSQVQQVITTTSHPTDLQSEGFIASQQADSYLQQRLLQHRDPVDTPQMPLAELFPELTGQARSANSVTGYNAQGQAFRVLDVLRDMPLYVQVNGQEHHYARLQDIPADVAWEDVYLAAEDAERAVARRYIQASAPQPKITLATQKGEKTFHGMSVLPTTHTLADGSSYTHSSEVERNIRFQLEAVRQIGAVMENLYQQLRAHNIHLDAADDLSTPLRLVNWVGVDADGNDNISPETARQTLRLQQQALQQFYIEQLEQVGSLLQDTTQKDGVKQVRAALEKGDTTIHTLTIPALQQRMHQRQAPEAAQAIMRQLVWQMQAAGYHLADIEHRQNAEVHEQALSRIFEDAAHLPPLLGAVTTWLMDPECPYHAYVQDVWDALIKAQTSPQTTYATLAPEDALVTAHHIRLPDGTSPAIPLKSMLQRILLAYVNSTDEQGNPVSVSGQPSFASQMLQRFERLYAQPEHMQALSEVDQLTAQRALNMIGIARVAAANPDAFRSVVVAETQDVTDLLEVQMVYQAVGYASPLETIPLYEHPDVLANVGTVQADIYQDPIYSKLLDAKEAATGVRSQQTMIAGSDNRRRGGSDGAIALIDQAIAILKNISAHAGVTFQLYAGNGMMDGGRGGGRFWPDDITRFDANFFKVTMQGADKYRFFGHQLADYAGKTLAAALDVVRHRDRMFTPEEQAQQPQQHYQQSIQQLFKPLLQEAMAAGAEGYFSHYSGNEVTGALLGSIYDYRGVKDVQIASRSASRPDPTPLGKMLSFIDKKLDGFYVQVSKARAITNTHTHFVTGDGLTYKGGGGLNERLQAGFDMMQAMMQGQSIQRDALAPWLQKLHDRLATALPDMQADPYVQTAFQHAMHKPFEERLQLLAACDPMFRDAMTFKVQGLATTDMLDIRQLVAQRSGQIVLQAAQAMQEIDQRLPTLTDAQDVAAMQELRGLMASLTRPETLQQLVAWGEKEYLDSAATAYAALQGEKLSDRLEVLKAHNGNRHIDPIHLIYDDAVRWHPALEGPLTDMRHEGELFRVMLKNKDLGGAFAALKDTTANALRVVGSLLAIGTTRGPLEEREAQQAMHRRNDVADGIIVSAAAEVQSMLSPTTTIPAP